MSGATLVVVVVGAEIYGACEADPMAALRVVARRASEDLATRRTSIDPKVIIERGREKWASEASGAEGPESSRPANSPRQAA